ncbi:MAG: hypothetical protein HKN22_08265 [Bacteroidia bacterium]|nr:hypothetical protein [Bacteroidia bacterium]
MLKNLICFLAVAMLISTHVDAQRNSIVKDSSLTFAEFGIHLGLSSPGADMGKRFGNNATAGGHFGFKFKKNWTLDAQVGFLFGSDVKEPGLLSNIVTEQGAIIGADGRLADVRIFERGYHLSINAGKLFSFNMPNPNSGILITVGAGFMQHKIKIEVIDATVPELNDEYIPGYDRLANGWMLKEFIGYRYYGNKKLINFLIGFEFIQGFTAGRRDYNYDTMVPGNEDRTDLLYGIKAGWIVPLYGKTKSTFYYD